MHQKSQNVSRREAIGLAGAALGASMAASLSTTTQASAAEKRPADEPFGYCFNTSTIRGEKLGLVDKIKIVAQAGFQAVEPWINEIDQYVAQGGSLPDLAKLIADLGLTVESAIGFAEWIVDDDQRRTKGLAEARRGMDLVRQIGGSRIAAPPAGATDAANLDLFAAARRYRALLELGDETGVVPQVELWGFSKPLSRLGETLLVAAESGHPKACVLLDAYHLYKGGSALAGLKMLAGAAMHVMHVNDYPADPPRESITDAHRVYPGDGVAPLGEMFRMLRDLGFRGYLSLELFNRDYWQQDPQLVARTGYQKLRAAVQRAFA